VVLKTARDPVPNILYHVMAQMAITINGGVITPPFMFISSYNCILKHD
jgi:hypothetical protein